MNRVLPRRCDAKIAVLARSPLILYINYTQLFKIVSIFYVLSSADEREVPI